MSENTIIFTQQQFQEADNFSKAVDTSLYAKRNQWNVAKRIEDTKVGKLAEIAVYALCKGTIPNLTYPDLEIYSVEDKSWDYDLKGTGINIHVKAQSLQSSILYGESWTFQKEDCHIFKSYGENDYVAFVLVNLGEYSATLRYVLPVSFLHQNNLFKPPKLKKLTSKLVIYYNDLCSHLKTI